MVISQSRSQSPFATCNPHWQEMLVPNGRETGCHGTFLKLPLTIYLIGTGSPKAVKMLISECSFHNLTLKRISLFSPPEYNILGYHEAFCNFLDRMVSRKALKKIIHRNNNKKKTGHRSNSENRLPLCKLK